MAKIDAFKLPNLKQAGKRSQQEFSVVSFNMQDECKTIGINKKYFIKTHGCQANNRDSEQLAGILEMMSYTKADSIKNADIVIINTCAIRQNAEEKVYGEIGALKQIKRKKPDFIICVCGCMAQEEASVRNLLTKYPQVDIVFGTHNIESLPKLIFDTISSSKRVVEILDRPETIVEKTPVSRSAGHKAYVNIMYGCDKFCTYCIVPFTRGKQRSRLKQDILNEVNELVESGYKEICLLGQNVNAYGKDLKDDYKFANLLEDCAKTQIKRLRFVTSHPWDFSSEMIDVIAKYSNIMPYIHLPLQSGSNNILKKMNRSYTTESYLKLFDSIKKVMPNVAITTDIIVGFPNESEDDFKQTLDVVDYCKYDNAFTFVFSPRIGTPAANMEDNLDIKIKEERLQILNKKIGYYSNLANQKYMDQIVEVLVDGPSKKNKDVFSGYTPEFKLVNFTGSNIHVGDLVNVKITSCKSYTLNGVKVD